MNFILMVVDSLRVDHLSCYGYEGNSTPNIDRVAYEGVLYKNAFSMGSYTSASFPYILSDYLLLNLRKKGYVSILIHSNPNLRVNRLPIIEIDLVRSQRRNRFQLKRVSNLRRFLHFIRTGTNAPYMNAEMVNKVAIRLMEELRDPFFLCLWYMDVHMPYIPPSPRGLIESLSVLMLNKRHRKALASGDYTKISEKDLKELIRLYDGEVSYMDECFGSFIKKIDVSNTCLILTADHGEEFMDHGEFGHPNKDVQCLRHIPFIIRHPKMKFCVINKPFYFRYLDKLILELLSCDGKL